MVAKKSKSKRQTLNIKYKIIKRVKQHEKRLKKGVIKNKRLKKINDQGIPSAWPYKEELLQEIQAAKDKMELVKEQQKEKRSLEMAKRRQLNKSIGSAVKDNTAEDDEMDTNAGSFSSQQNSINQQANLLNSDGSMDLLSRDAGQNSRRAFLKELRKVIDNSDVILHVLDARDPIGTRSLAIEEMVLGSLNKKLVYVLNKADLVPRDVLVSWLTFLRKSHPTLLFKSNTQQQKSNLGRMGGKISKMDETAIHNTSHAIGTEELLNILKNYARTNGSGGSNASTNKAMISVGIVGFPNVGKSSLINSLLRIRKVGVSSVPGFTKTYQEVILDKNIRLIDCPGIVFAEEHDTDAASAALRNCVNVDEIADVYSPIQAILERCPQSYLMQLYNIPKFKEGDGMAFLSLVASVTGKLKKGGIPNTDATARTILHDWNHGKIKYYCKLPVDAEGKAIDNLSVLTGTSTVTAAEAAMVDKEAKILSGYSKKAFQVDNMKTGTNASNDMEVEEESAEQQLLDQLDSDELCDYVGIDASKSQKPTYVRSVGVMDEDEDLPKRAKKNTDKNATVDQPSQFTGRSAETIAVDRKIKQIKMTTASTVHQVSDDVNNATVVNNAIMTSNTNSTVNSKNNINAIDMRKNQKEEKKRMDKLIRRSEKSAVGGSYDFDTDFQY